METNHVLKYADLEQGSEAWHQLRIGKFSASEIHRLMGDCKREMTDSELKAWKEANPKSQAKTIVDPYLLSDGALSYVIEIASERLTGRPAKELFDNDAVRWGREHEPEAKKLYSMVYEVEGINVGFVEYSEGAGASPDWIVLDKFGCEVKCPITRDKHLQYFMLQNAQDLKDKFKDHYYQCLKGMLATGYKMWKFISYHPHYPPAMQLKVLNIPRNEDDIELLKCKLEVAEEQVSQILTLNKK